MANKKKYTYDYPMPAVTVDVVLITTGRQPKVLLIQRKSPPFAQAWALPGGFAEPNETLEAAARRELLEETGVAVESLEQVQAFGNPGRDPRGWVVSIAFVARVSADLHKPLGSDDALRADWHPLKQLPELAFDHREILRTACGRLKLSCS